MSMETLTSSLGSLVEESLYTSGEVEADDLLRRLSPYTTLRPRDLTVLLGNQRGPSSDHTHRKWASSLFDNAIVERSDSEGESDKDEEEDLQERDLVVRGQDAPAEYVVRGLRRNEMPVIGVYVDPRITPGFRYTIRRLGTESFLFRGRAMRLLSVGLGYGKRLTFAGDSHNFNDNYFWSDSDPNGFAFSLEAVEPAQVLTVYKNDGSGIVGEVKVDRVLGVQEEISSEVVEGDIIKRCQVSLQCQVTYFQSQHGRIDLKLHDLERLTGQAVVIKKRKTRVAALDCIEQVALAGVSGPCTLQASER